MTEDVKTSLQESVQCKTAFLTVYIKNYLKYAIKNWCTNSLLTLDASAV